jgi:hypothetical protein
MGKNSQKNICAVTAIFRVDLICSLIDLSQFSHACFITTSEPEHLVAPSELK